MGLHPSLKMDSAGSKQKSVLTRIERIKELMKKGLWAENQSVTGLPKSKVLRIKARKSAKAKEEAAAPGSEQAGQPAAPSAAGAPAKEAKAQPAKK